MTTFDIFQDGESETASSDVWHSQTNRGWCSLVRSLTSSDLVFCLNFQGGYGAWRLPDPQRHQGCECRHGDLQRWRPLRRAGQVPT